jgi:coproporphyrinogen III oxidase
MNETMGMSYASLYYAEVGKNNELQKENKKLKELCDKYEEEHSTEFKIWKDERHQLLYYKSRNEKAIEYIELGLANEEEAEKLLNILKRSDKE